MFSLKSDVLLFIKWNIYKQHLQLHATVQSRNSYSQKKVLEIMCLPLIDNYPQDFSAWPLGGQKQKKLDWYVTRLKLFRWTDWPGWEAERVSR